jgi:autotransporter adhesin
VFGLGNTVNATNAVAIGNSNTVTGANGVAIGNGATVAGSGGIAVGTNASASSANSAAFGNGATTTRANQMVFGTATATYTMPGITSGASGAVQSGAVDIVTTDASGNLAATTPGALGLATVSQLNQINSQLTGKINQAYAGVASAFAMAGTPMLQVNETFAVSMNGGFFENSQGAALAAAYRLGPNVQANGGFGVGFTNGARDVYGGRVGVRFGW